MVLKRVQTLIQIMENPPYQVGYHNFTTFTPLSKRVPYTPKTTKIYQNMAKIGHLRLFLAISNSEYEQGSGRDARTHSNKTYI